MELPRTCLTEHLRRRPVLGLPAGPRVDRRQRVPGPHRRLPAGQAAPDPADPARRVAREPARAPGHPPVHAERIAAGDSIARPGCRTDDARPGPARRRQGRTTIALVLRVVATAIDLRHRRRCMVLGEIGINLGAAARRRRHRRHRHRLRRPEPGEGLPLRRVHAHRGPVRRRRRRRPRRGHRHGRGGDAAVDAAARRERHGVARAERRDPAGRQQEPAVVARR